MLVRLIAYMAGDEIEFKRIVQETVYGAICGAIGGVESKVIKVRVSMLVDVVNSIIKETILEKKHPNEKILGTALLNAAENQLISVLWNHKCGDDKIYKEVRNAAKDKADAAELTLKTVKKETKDVMGKKFKKLQKKIYQDDTRLFWDSILDFAKKENLYVAENTILWKKVKKSTMKQLRKSVREDIIMNGGCPA